MNVSDYLNFDLSVSKVDLALSKKCPLNWELKSVSRKYYGLVYILSGNADYIFSDRVEHVVENDILYLKKGDAYYTKSFSDTPFAFIVISFDIENNVSLPFETVSRIRHAKRFLEMFKYIEEVCFAKSIGYKLCCRSMMEQLIYHLLKEHLHPTKATENMQATTDYIENYYDQKIEMKVLANIAQISPSHFRRKFKMLYGASPIEYVNRLRVEKAKDMLKSGLYAQNEIAALCGFENVYYFSRVFKKFTNLSPGAY